MPFIDESNKTLIDSITCELLGASGVMYFQRTDFTHFRRTLLASILTNHKSLAEQFGSDHLIAAIATEMFEQFGVPTELLLK